jgi:hypothetical protein
MTRPTIYTDELAEKICDLLAEGKSMVKACEALGVCRRTVNLWLKKNPEFANMTVEARESYSDDIVDKLIEIAGDETKDYHTRRLLIDSIKWVAGKQRPKKYSEKFMVEHAGAVGHNHTITEMTDAELEALIRAGSSRITSAQESEG